MKTAADFVEDFFVSPEMHKQGATTLRRLKGGVEAEWKRAEYYGLSDKEKKLLSETIDLLSKMANLRTQAGALRAKQLAERQQREEQAMATMADTFCKLQSIEDRVSLVAAVSPVALKEWGGKTSKDLDAAFKDALDGIAFRVATSAGPIAEIVARYWAEYMKVKSGHEGRYRHIIDALKG